MPVFDSVQREDVEGVGPGNGEGEERRGNLSGVYRVFYKSKMRLVPREEKKTSGGRFEPGTYRCNSFDVATTLPGRANRLHICTHSFNRQWIS